MNKHKDILNIFLRYLIVLFSSLGNFYIFYKILTPLTVKTLTFLLSLKSPAIDVKNFIYLKDLTIEIIPSCVAASAFFLLFFLCMSIPKIYLKKRLKLIITSFFLFFTLNISRMLILIALTNKPYFETLHWIFWNLASTIFLIFIWFLIIRIFKIKNIPVYSDFKYIKSLKSRKKSKRN